MYQLVIINPQGAKLRTAPNTSGGEIRLLPAGKVVDVEHLVFLEPSQVFDTNSIPAFLDALEKNIVRGDVWVKLPGLHFYRAQQVSAYCALRVGSTIYGALAGSSDVPPAADEKAAYNRAIDDCMDALVRMRK